MALIMRIDTAPGFAPKQTKADHDRLISGDPSFKTWAQDVSRGDVRTGVWEATPGETRSIKGESFEFCMILSGRVEIEEAGGETHRFGAGDAFVMKPGFVGVWRTLETARKIYVIVG